MERLQEVKSGTYADVARSNAKLILPQVRGKTKQQRHELLNAFRLGVLSPLVKVISLWRDGEKVF